jgi:hypothetical protein
VLWFLRPVRRQSQAFAPEYVASLRSSILESPFLSANTLNARFSSTRGFSITFRPSGMGRLLKHFPTFGPYLDKVMGSRSNAFFLNPLVLGQGTYVSPHIDCSLRSFTRPDEPPLPSKVSVLYVDVPQPFEGGTLILHRQKPVARVEPKSNLLVEFLGSLKHEVTAVERCGPEGEPASRVSLVCEHYRLPEELLERVPEFLLNTKRPFADFMGSQDTDEIPCPG